MQKQNLALMTAVLALVCANSAKADVYSATNATQDVHYIQAKPSLIAKIRQADMVVCSGADLEIGWLPLILRKTGSSKVQ